MQKRGESQRYKKDQRRNIRRYPAREKGKRIGRSGGKSPSFRETKKLINRGKVGCQKGYRRSGRMRDLS